MRGLSGSSLLVLKSAEHNHVGQQSQPHSLSQDRCRNYLLKHLFFARCREWPVLVKEAVFVVTHWSVTQMWHVQLPFSLTDFRASYVEAPDTNQNNVFISLVWAHHHTISEATSVHGNLQYLYDKKLSAFNIFFQITHPN